MLSTTSELPGSSFQRAVVVGVVVGAFDDRRCRGAAGDWVFTTRSSVQPPIVSRSALLVKMVVPPGGVQTAGWTLDDHQAAGRKSAAKRLHEVGFARLADARIAGIAEHIDALERHQVVLLKLEPGVPRSSMYS